MGALCSAQRDGEYEDPERLQQLLQEGVEKDLKIAALQEQCEELLDAQLDAQRDANFERRTSKEAVSAEEVQALRKENEELRQRLRDTVNELAALREADANAATGMAPRIEAAAIRAYADIHRRLVAKHVRAPSGVRVRGAPGLTRSRDTNAATELKRLKRLAGSVVGAGDRSRRLVETGTKKAGPSASDGPSAAAARAEARRAADAEKAAANKKLDVQRRAREWNSR